MTSKIQTLPSEVVNLIAAGEVIDSLAAVIRELVENALDAGATRIVISLWADQWRVRVADNGLGMTLENLQQAATPHSTSKIRDSEDLWQINSLGFRGEALHSLAQLAELEICSCTADTQEGWHVRYGTQGEPIETDVTAIAPGTIVTASNLFNTWLPRRQGLPSVAQQLRTVQLTIQQLALCHPYVTWQIEQGDRLWFSIWPGKTARQILPQILREVESNDLQELTLEVEAPDHSDTSARLYLLMGLPDRCHRYRPDWIKVAVNGRMIKIPDLEQTIQAAFRRTLPRDRHPVCFVHLQVPPSQIDWNRHPAKAEIYLHHMDYWRTQVLDAIAKAMRLNPTALPDAAYTDPVNQLLKTAESPANYPSRQIHPLSDSLPTPHTPHPTPLKAIAQVHNMYILVEHPTGVWLIEQHIAHERVLYEHLRDRWELVPLNPPVILSQLTPGQLEQLQRIGIEVDLFGDDLWAIRTAPEALAQREDCADALLELSLGGNLEAAIVATACRTAIRNGTTLGLQEMQTLLEQWQNTQNPRTCPHGRPICLSLEESSLSRFFRRHWVIGKSHGI
ncbi:MAG TPA: DNA mismatch repair endonuclease MutL [Crinalium sp.]|jgi:DNA mismatch repair protein MutL